MWSSCFQKPLCQLDWNLEWNITWNSWKTKFLAQSNTVLNLTSWGWYKIHLVRNCYANLFKFGLKPLIDMLTWLKHCVQRTFTNLTFYSMLFNKPYNLHKYYMVDFSLYHWDGVLGYAGFSNSFSISALWILW